MKKLLITLIAPLLFAACVKPDIAPPDSPEEPKGEAGKIVSFGFLKQNNPDAVLANVVATVRKGEILTCSPMLLDVSNLVATFKTDMGRVYIGDTEQISGTTSNDFSQPLTYRVVTDQGVESEWLVSISNTGLPVVVITTPGNAAIPPKTEDWLEGTKLTIYSSEGGVDFDGEVNIRGRGNSTWTFPKKPYAIKLNEKASILGMPKHKRWVLLANWLDKTMLRNATSFHIASLTGLEWTPRGEFVEVVLNGRHKGNYYLCEQIKIDKNRVDIAEVSDSDPSGGYLMELDVYFDEVFKFHSPVRSMPFMFKDPDEVSALQQAYMENFVATLEGALYDDIRFATREYADYLDVDSFIDWWLVHELTGNSEPMHPKSSYMHKDSGGKLKAGPVWDFDWETFVPYKSNVFVDKEAIYYGRLFQDELFVARLKERWSELKPAFDGVGDYILREAERLAPSAALNNKMWPINVVVNGDEQLTYEVAVERMYSSFVSKLKWLDQQIEGM